MKESLDTQINIGPNASMSVGLAKGFLSLSAAISLGIAFWLTWLGFWPVLPFAGLEVGALALALWITLRRNRYREVIHFNGDRITIEFGVVGRGMLSSTELPRGWARVELRPSELRNQPSKLWLSCSGHRVRIGACLTNEEREALAVRLRELTGSQWMKALRQGSYEGPYAEK